jgi:hypothetical protein
MKPLALTTVLVFASCGGKSAPATEPSKAPVRIEDPSCPLEVPGTSLSVEDTPDGAALVFVTTGDAFAVRARAAKLADVHNERNGEPAWLGMMFTAGSKATATEVTGGARVELAAAHPDGAAAIQNELRMHASHLSSGSCEM